MSFLPARTSSPHSLSPKNGDDTVPDPENQPLIEHETHITDDKQEPGPQFNIPTAPDSRLNLPTAGEDYRFATEGSIRLGSPEPQVSRPWAVLGWPERFTNSRPENRAVLDDITRGLLILVTTPIAIASMALYTSGMIIEAIALMLKGVGSLGGRVLNIGRRRSQSPDPEWV